MLHMVSFVISFCVFCAANDQLKGQGNSPEFGAFVSRSFKSCSLSSPPCLFDADLNEICAVAQWSCENDTPAPQSTWAHSLSYQVKLPSRALCSYTNTIDLNGPDKLSKTRAVNNNALLPLTYQWQINPFSQPSATLLNSASCCRTRPELSLNDIFGCLQS